MSGACGNSSVLPISKMFIFIFCFISTVYGDDSFRCIWEDPMPDDHFTPDKYGYIGYVKDCALELGRVLHRHLGLSIPTAHCQHLASIRTNFHGRRPRPIPRTYDFGGHPENLLENIEDAAIQMFNNFNTDEDYIYRQLDEDDKGNIYDAINEAIRRLLTTGSYAINCDLLNAIRQLKTTYTEDLIHTGLTIDGQPQTEPPTNTQSLLNSFDFLTTALYDFLNQGVAEVSMQNSLYVVRNEMAVMRQYDQSVTTVGSDLASNCIIIILTHEVTNGIGVTHVCDAENSNTAVEELIVDVANLDDAEEHIFSLYLIGGSFNVEDLFYSVMDNFHLRDEQIHLVLVAVGAFNSVMENGIETPRITGAAINTETLIVFPATFSYRGPDYELRLARSIVGHEEVESFYNCEKGWFSIEPFNYEYNNAASMLRRTPEYLQRRYPGIVQIREAMLFLFENPTTAHAFPNGETLNYKRDDYTRSYWVRFDPDE